MVKSTCCSAEDLGLTSITTCWHAFTPNSYPRDLMPFSGLVRVRHVYIYTHTDKTLTYIQVFFFLKFNLYFGWDKVFFFYVYATVYLSLLFIVHVCMCMCNWRLAWDKVFLCLPFILFFETASHWPGTWPASPRDTPVSASSVLGLVSKCCGQLWHGFWRFRLRSV